MKESLHFNYDGISSRDMGLVQIITDRGLVSEFFVAQRKINEEIIRGRDRVYHKGVEYSPLSFPLEFLIEDESADLREIARWLSQDYYKPFYFEDFPERVFYCMYDGQPERIHNAGINKGYVKLQMRCDSRFSYSPIYLDDPITVTTNTSFEFNNYGDVPIKPVLEIKTIGAGDVRILNKANGLLFEFSNLTANETIYVDCEEEEIETDLPNMYRYDDFNNNYLEFEVGRNLLEAYGNFTVQLKYQFKTMH